jgi:hypothetical protein
MRPPCTQLLLRPPAPCFLAADADVGQQPIIAR